jgi:hypothetical protein
LRIEIKRACTFAFSDDVRLKAYLIGRSNVASQAAEQELPEVGS